MAGIVTALHLAERGLRPIVLEADGAGGRLAGGVDVTLTAGVSPSSSPVSMAFTPSGAKYRNLKALLRRYDCPAALFLPRTGVDLRAAWAGALRRTRLGRDQEP